MKGRIIEQGFGVMESFRELPGNVNLHNVTAAMIGTVFAIAGPLMLLINISNDAHLTNDQTVTWMFGFFFLAGIQMMFLNVYYRQPMAIGFSLPGIIVIGYLLKVFPHDQMAGAYIVAALALIFLGLTGLIKKVVRYLPLPIVMAMIAGALLSYGLGIVSSVQKDYAGAGLTVLAFFLSRLFTKKVPPQVTALVVGIIVSIFLMKWHMTVGNFSFNLVFVSPSFSAPAIVSVGLPLLLLTLADFLKGNGILLVNKYNTPTNAVISLTGLFGVIGGPLLSPGYTLAGPLTAILAADEAGPRESRWVGAFVKGFVQILFAAFAVFLVPFLKSLPGTIINLLAGLAMISLFTNAFDTAFRSDNKLQIGAFFAFIVACSNISIYHIASPVWSLLVGVAVSFIFERENLKASLGIGEQSIKSTVIGEGVVGGGNAL
jgi:benzoate membrane transport protein